MRVLSARIAGPVLLTSLLQIVIFPVAGPLPLWRAALAWVALVPMLAVLVRSTGRLRDAALMGYAVGFLWYMGSCYWVYDTMHQYGGIPAAMSAVILVLFSLYLGLYHALFGFLIGVVARRSRVLALCAAPLLWVAVELARARVTSFPWDLLGYSQIDNGLLTRMAPWTGIYGLSFVLAAVGAAMAAWVVLRTRRSALVGVCGLLAAFVLQLAGLSHAAVVAGSQTAVMLQPNLSVGPSEGPASGPLLQEFAGLSLAAAHSPALILWPESPAPFQTNQPEFIAHMSALATQAQAPVIAGAVGLDADASVRRGYRIYNSAAAFTPQAGYVARYSKIHLVPFGEFVPYANLFSFASGLTQAVGVFDRGTSRQGVVADGHRYGVFLCYESIFGDEVRSFVGNGAQVLVNLSDDGWYGDTSAPFQHINMARMRAMENRRWLLRDTNNGTTASIDPAGAVVETMPRHVRSAVAMHFSYRSDITFYTRYGDVFAYACTVLALLCVLGAAVRTAPANAA